MKNEEFVNQVNSGHFPEGPEVPLDPAFEDARGKIQNIWLGDSKSVTVITSKKGSVRANHKHQNDWHAIYVVSGILKYQITTDDGVSDSTVYQSGQMFFTPPDLHHTVTALKDTVFLTINGIVKNHENYENSIIRAST